MKRMTPFIGPLAQTWEAILATARLRAILDPLVQVHVASAAGTRRSAGRGGPLLCGALLAIALLIAPGTSGTAAVAAQATGERPQIVRETEIDRQTRALASQLRCVVCQGLSLEDSPSQLAQEMRAVIREQLEAGSSPAEVKQYFVDKYGEWVLLQPEAKGFNLVVYVLPVLMLLGGALFVYTTARRMTQRGPAGAETDAPTAGMTGEI